MRMLRVIIDADIDKNTHTQMALSNHPCTLKPRPLFISPPGVHFLLLTSPVPINVCNCLACLMSSEKERRVFLPGSEITLT